MTTRFLFSVIPSELYWQDQTLDGLLSALTDDLQQLYETGLSVALLYMQSQGCSVGKIVDRCVFAFIDGTSYSIL